MNRPSSPIAFEPPPTQARARSGSRPSTATTWAAASSPIRRWRSRTIVGYGCGPIAEPEHVVGRLDVRDPVAHRVVDRVLERRAAARDRPDLRAERAHPEHVRLLALDVLGAHVDDARQPEQGAGGRGRDAVLAGAGLGDDPGLAEPPRQQRLAERVVDLVGAGVGEVLALEVEAEAARQAGRSVGGDRPLERLVGEAVGAVERRRAAGEAREQLAQLRPEPRVVAELRRTPSSSCASAAISVSGT